MNGILFSDLLVAEEGKESTTDDQEKPKEEEILRIQLIKDAQRTFEQRCRVYADIFAQESDSDHENDDDDDDDDDNHHKENKKSRSSSDNDSSLPSTTDSESPYGSDSESSSSYDEYYAVRKIPKKKIHRHGKGPVKLYIKEMIGNWPKYRYKKYQRNYMKKHGIQISYGNVHTKDIKRSLKREKHERHKVDCSPQTIIHMMGDLAKQSVFLSLDPEHPLVPTELERSSITSIKFDEDEPSGETKPKSTFEKVKRKMSKPFKRTDKRSSKLGVPDGNNGHSLSNSDAGSIASVDEESHQPS